MRWPWVFSIALAFAAIAEARPQPPPRAQNGDFWRELLEPNADEVSAIVAKARDLMQRPEQPDTEWAIEHRARFYRDARNLLAYARKLSPQNTEVLALLGRVHDELGDTASAIEALEACTRISGPDKVVIDAAGRLGAIQMRLGNEAAALDWLRRAQAPLSAISVSSIVNLATVLAAQGDSGKAIDTLLGAIPQSMFGNYSSEITIASFALAVLYDRDEQRAAAFSVIDQMQNGLQHMYAKSVQDELAKMRFPHIEDLHYYRALLYESLGQYVEARAEWAHYAAAGETPWRARALAHVAAIDAQRRLKPGAPPHPPSVDPMQHQRIRRHP